MVEKIVKEKTDEEMHEIHYENGMHGCFCNVCHNASKPGRMHDTLYRVPAKLKISLDIRERDQYYKKSHGGEPQTFYWLMQHLLSYSEKIKGCELIFPDTVFFENGDAKSIIKTDKDFCLISVKNQSKLSL